MKCIFKNLIIIVAALGLCSGAIAQTPVPEATPVPDSAVAPSNEPSPPASGLVPETEEKAPEAAKKETPQTAMSLNPYVWIKPLNLDKDQGSYVPSLGIEPGADFLADFSTATKRKISLSLGYLLIFKQYLDKGYDRFFEHDLSFGFSHDLTSKFSVAAPGVFYIGQWYSAENQGGNYVSYELFPAVAYKITDKLTSKLGYYGFFNYDPNVIRSYDEVDSITNPPSEAGDITKGTAGVYDYYDPYGYQSNPYYPAFAPVAPMPGGEVQKMFLHGITMDLSYRFTPKTTGTFKYHYYGKVTSNNDESEYTGHQIYFILNQSVWEGGNLNLQWRIRRRAFSYAFADDGSNKIDWRHRIYFTLSQTVNDYLTVEAFWRLQHIRSNASDPVNINDAYLGTKFSF